MRTIAGGPLENYFLKLCDDYIACDDLEQAKTAIERLSTKFSGFETAIEKLQDPIFSTSDCLNRQADEFDQVYAEVVLARCGVDEILEAILAGGKAEVLLKWTHSKFSFQEE